MTSVAQFSGTAFSTNADTMMTALLPDPLPDRIGITTANDREPLPYGAEFWCWERPLYMSATETEERQFAMNCLYPDLGNARIIFVCEILRTYLVMGLDGWYIVDFTLNWRGYVGSIWDEVLDRIKHYELWTMTDLLEPSSEQWREGWERHETQKKSPPAMTAEEKEELILMEKMDGLQPG